MSGEPRQQIPELGQLDLHLAFPRVRPSGKNIQNELGAIDDFEIGHLGNGPGLRRGEILVEDHEVGALLKRAHHDLFQFALPEQIPLVALMGALRNSIQDANAGGFGQFIQFFQVLFLFGVTLG